MNYKYIYLAFLCCTSTVFGQSDTYPFIPGETVKYDVYYHWGLLWVNVADVIFITEKTNYNGQDVWYLKATGATHPFYDMFYQVRDTFETRLTFPGFDPLWFRRVLHHKKWFSSHEYFFDHVKKEIVSNINRGGRVSSVKYDYTLGIHDILSSAYHFRGYDYESLKPGQKVEFTMLIDNKTDSLYFIYQGIEKIKTRNKRTFSCHKVLVSLLEGDFFPGQQEMTVWFTADKNRVPVLAEAKILVGSVRGIIKEENTLKYPLMPE